MSNVTNISLLPSFYEGAVVASLLLRAISSLKFEMTLRRVWRMVSCTM